MAISPVGPSALNSPLAVQAQAPDILRPEENPRRVTAPGETRSADRDARALAEDRADRKRSERSGQFSNTGTRGTRGGSAGLLSRGPSTGADGARETQADRYENTGRFDEMQNRSSEERKEFTVKDSGTVVSRTEIRNPVFDRVKSAMFVDRLDEIRSAEAAPATEQPVQASVAGSPSDASETATGRFDKRA